MIEASFEAVIPKAINAEFEAIIPREKAFDIVNKDIHIDTNGRYEVKADAGTAMTQVNVEVDIQPKEFKDVNFYDYEGTILHSYTWDEFVEKNEMPPLPTHHKGLVCQEWNYTLEEVLEQGGRCDVGAIYIPEDGNTHIIVKISNKDKESANFSFFQKAEHAVVIDWGDGIVESRADVGVRMYFEHHYDKCGVYDITLSGAPYNFLLGFEQFIPAIEVYAAQLQYQVNSSMQYSLVSKVTASKKTSNGCGIGPFVKHFNVPVNNNSYNICSVQEGMLETISLSAEQAQIGGSDFATQKYLKRIHLPSKVKVTSKSSSCQWSFIEDYSCSNANVEVSVVGNCIVKNGDTVFSGTRNSEIPQGILCIGASAFQFCIGLKEIILPDSLTTINSYAFAYCYNVNQGVKFPKNVTHFGDRAFLGSKNIPFYDFREHETIPTLSSVYVFGNNLSTVKIVVPDALYDQWIVATNWATYASRIVKASEFVEPTNN